MIFIRSFCSISGFGFRRARCAVGRRCGRRRWPATMTIFCVCGAIVWGIGIGFLVSFWARHTHTHKYCTWFLVFGFRFFFIGTRQMSSWVRGHRHFFFVYMWREKWEKFHWVNYKYKRLKNYKILFRKILKQFYL